MFEMDVMAKGLSWIDGMYQKFETVCLEVDENPSSLLEGTKKYVENQFSVIGENVKKFYVEVIQDILPPDPDTALKNLSSNMAVNLEEDFDLFEKLNPEKLQRLDSESMPHETLKQSFEYAGEDSNCVIPFPHELENDIPVIYLKEPSESEISELIPSLSNGDTFLSEDSILKDVFSESMPHDTLKQSFEYAGEDSNGLIPFPHELEKDIPVIYLKEPSESEISELIPSLSNGDTFLSEDSILKDVTQRQFHSQREANLFNNTSHVIYLSQEPTCVATVAEQAPWKEQGSTNESEFGIDNQKSTDICGVVEVKVNDNSIPRVGIVEIIGKSGKQFTEETYDGNENPGGHEKDGENTMAAVKTFIPKYPCLSKEEPSYELLAGQEDGIEESAYWYGYEDMDVEKWQDIEKCDSDWELL